MSIATASRISPHGIHARSDKWIVLDALDQVRSQRILQDVSRHTQRGFIVSQRPFVTISLPGLWPNVLA